MGPNCGRSVRGTGGVGQLPEGNVLKVVRSYTLFGSPSLTPSLTVSLPTLPDRNLIN